MDLPWILIALGCVLLAGLVLGLILYKMRKARDNNPLKDINKKAFFIQWLTGLALALLAAYFMFDGDILGENTSGIATVMGIIGISVIATASVTGRAFKRKSS